MFTFDPSVYIVSTTSLPQPFHNYSDPFDHNHNTAAPDDDNTQKPSLTRHEKITSLQVFTFSVVLRLFWFDFKPAGSGLINSMGKRL